MARASNREMVTSNAYATAADFERVFTEDMSGLYLLSFLLTGDRDEAEGCFVAGIGKATKGNRVFKAWARSWARRTIIQSAIRLLAPSPHSEGAVRNPVVARTIGKLPLMLQAEVSAILELPQFDRFVFIMSTLERYSDHDCSILLGCSRKDVSTARARALQQLGRLMTVQENQTQAGSGASAANENSRSTIEMTIARYFALPAWGGSFSQDAPLWP
jgi:DNA-directed RNA polymerase specialized sigma24 family protein